MKIFDIKSKRHLSCSKNRVGYKMAVQSKEEFCGLGKT